MIERFTGRPYYEQGQSLNLRDWLHAMQAKLNEVIDAVNLAQTTLAELRGSAPDDMEASNE